MLKKFLFMFLMTGVLFAGDNEKLTKTLSIFNFPPKNSILSTPAMFISDLNAVLELDNDDLLILVDKKHSLSKDYVPNDLIKLQSGNIFNISRNDLSLRKPAYDALLEMAKAAKQDGITLTVSSTYRSYNYQATVYERNVKELGKAVADLESAEPGKSQHQLGTAVDFGSITDDFANTSEGKWLFKNAAKFGWSLSFPNGYQKVTGYRGECWHFRYIGVDAILFQQKWFNNVQQYMMEFLNEWKSQK